MKGILIRIREDVYFSNGVQLNAQIVSESIQQTAKQLGKELDWAFGNIKGFKNFIQSKSKKINGIKQIDKFTIEVEFDKPFSLFPSVLASPYFSIYIKNKHNFFGTNSYKIIHLDQNKVSIKKWKDLNRNGPEFANFIKIDSHKASNKNQIRQFDLIDVGQKEIESDNLKKITFTYFQSILLVLNTNSEPFNIASNRCQFIEKFFKKNEKFNDTWNPIQIGLPFSWDLFRNYKKLDSIRHKSKLSNHKLHLYFADSAAKFNDFTNEKIKSDLKSEHIDVTFKKMDIRELIKKIKEGDFDATLIGFVPDYIHPDALLYPIFKTNQQYNFSRYSNQKIDSLLEKARSIADSKDQIVLYKKIIEIINKDCPIAFLGTQPGQIYISKKWLLPKIGIQGFHKIKLIDFITQ